MRVVKCGEAPGLNQARCCTLCHSSQRHMNSHLLYKHESNNLNVSFIG